jgi:hypothetical protein
VLAHPTVITGGIPWLSRDHLTGGTLTRYDTGALCDPLS